MSTVYDIDEIVRQTVADAIRTGELLQVNREARRLAAETDLPRHEIARELFEAGIAARINMEFGARSGTVIEERWKPESVGAVIRSAGVEPSRGRNMPSLHYTEQDV